MTLAFASLFIAHLSPIGLPVTITHFTYEIYDIIEGLDEGDVILYDINWSGYGEHSANVLAITQHLFERPITIIMLSDDAPGMTQVTTDNLISGEKMIGGVVLDKHGKVYGTDYVYLGFTPGWEAMIAELALCPTCVYPTDYYETPTEGMPIFDVYNTWEDIDLVVCQSAKHNPRYYIYQWNVPFGVPVMAIVDSREFPETLTYYVGGQLVALSNGGRGGAEYELLRGVAGPGLASQDAMSLITIVTLVFFGIGNISYLYTKYTGGEAAWAIDRAGWGGTSEEIEET